MTDYFIVDVSETTTRSVKIAAEDSDAAIDRARAGEGEEVGFDVVDRQVLGARLL